MTTSETGVVAPATLRPVQMSAFPVAVDLDGKVESPVLLHATKSATQIWGLVDATPTLLASFPPLVARPRRQATLSNGSVARWAAEFEDGTELLIGRAAGCGCGHMLKRWRPPVVA